MAKGNPHNVPQNAFAKKYYNAIGGNDLATRDEMIATELARLIDEKPLTVMQLIDNSGWKFVNAPKTKADLIDAVAEMMIKSAEFNRQISLLVAINNKVLSFNQITELGQTGKMPPYYNAMGEGLIQTIVSAVSALGSGGLSLGAAVENRKAGNIQLEAIKAQAATQTKQATEATKQALLNAITAKTLSNQSQGPSQTAIIVGAGVFLLIAFGVFYILSRPKPQVAVATPPMATGGAPAATTSIPPVPADDPFLLASSSAAAPAAPVAPVAPIISSPTPPAV